MSNKLLDLTTLVERPTIVVDGEPHELRNRDELGLVEDHRIVSLQRKINKLGQDFSLLTEEQVAESIQALDEILGIICPTLPVAKLTDVQKARCVEAWAAQYQAVVEEPEAGESGEDERQTGVN